MDEQTDQDSVSGASMDAQVTEPSVASSLQTAQPQQPTIVPQTVLPTAPQPAFVQTTSPTQTAIDKIVSTTSQSTATTSDEPPTLSPDARKLTKSKWFIPAIFAGFLVLGGGAAAYVSVFQKSPESIWSSALSNTANGIEKYLATAYGDEQSKGFKVDGNFKVSSPIAVDGSMEGQWYGSNGLLKGNIGAGGVRFDTELRTIAEQTGNTPDIYMQVSGLDGFDSLIDSLGGSGSGISSQVKQVNGQWYYVDHTLIDQYVASTSTDTANMEFSEQELKETIDTFMVVLKDRMFGTAEDKAIFKIVETIGKEDFEGTPSYKMKVKVDQNNFKDFVVALKDATKETKLNDLMTQGQEGKSIEELINFDQLIEELEKADFSKATADVWAEARGGFIRNIRFYPTEDKKESNYLDFGMNYQGGDVFPFLIRATIDDNDVKGVLGFGFNINQNNGDGGLTVNVDLNGEGMKVQAEAALNIVGLDEEVSVEKPENAKSYVELLSILTSGLYQQPAGQSLYDDIGSDFPSSSFPLDDLEL